VTSVRGLTIGGVCVALAVVISFLFHSLASPRIFLPMHYPVFLAGTLLDPFGAAVVGLLSPALSTGLTGMPTPEQTLRMM
jgi:niacin transporter